jgi:hypothetical protein
VSGQRRERGQAPKREEDHQGQSPWLRAALIEAAQDAGRTKNTYVSRRSTADSRPVGARRRSLWPSVAPSWSSPIVYSSARVAMRSYAATTSISGIAKPSSVVLRGAWKYWATKPPSIRSQANRATSFILTPAWGLLGSSQPLATRKQHQR